MINAFLQWFDSFSAVGIDVFIIVFKLLIPSIIATYILWVKPGYYKAVMDRSQTGNPSAFEGLFSLLFACCFCTMIFSIFLLVVFSLLAVGL